MQPTDSCGRRRKSSADGSGSPPEHGLRLHTEPGSLFTIGHSNRTFEGFLALLKAHAIEQLVDIRSIPKSRHNPQFNKKELARTVRNRRIGYRHLKDLGGLRHASRDSVNTGWENPSFRGFADYMATAPFARALEKLKTIARRKRTAVMCAEAVPWRCHRSLVADALVKQHWAVFHIMTSNTARRHKPTPFLRVRKGSLYYPSPDFQFDKTGIRSTV